MVTVYSRKNCVQCTATYRKLDLLGVKYAVVDLETAPTALRESILGLGFQQAPVVEHGDRFFSGYRPDLLEAIARELPE